MKFHLLDSAIKVFDEIPEPNITSLNVAIYGFSQNGYCEEAFRIFRLVSMPWLRPDSVTVACLLSACQDVKKGSRVLCWKIKIGVEQDIYAATSLVTMYANCRELMLASKAFEQIQHKNLVCYNVFVSGLVQNGIPLLVLDVFEEINRSYQEPNSATFNCILSVCSHSGQVDKGREIFKLMNLVYGLKPTTEHFSCMVDLLGRSGRLDEARNFCKKYQNLLVLFSLLYLELLCVIQNPSLGKRWLKGY